MSGESGSGHARLGELALRVEGYALEGLRLNVTGGFERHTTVVRLHGEGTEGAGEDVTWEVEDQRAFREGGATLPLRGRWTLAGFSRRLDEVELFPEPPRREASRSYRRWAFESAALDLALRQNGLSLARALGRECSDVRFVLSLSLGGPPTLEPLLAWLDARPEARFKLDASPEWTAELIRGLADTGAIDTVDFKGAYRGTVVDQPADAALYRRVAEGLPAVWLEDPALTADTEAVLAPHRERITWDAPIHTVADVEALPHRPRALNLKPSRSGTLRALLELYDHCRGRGIGLYGGGQFELGPGRAQIQYLAGLFHPAAPNDVAPRVYHDARPGPGLPASPLAIVPAATGFTLQRSDLP